MNMSDRKFTNTTLTTVTTAGVIDNLVLVAQGTASTNRVGNQIRLNALTLSGYFSLPAGSAGDIVRMIVAVDHEAKGAAPAVTDVLQAATVQSPYNLDNVGPRMRFRILADKFLPLSQQTATVGVQYRPVQVQVPVRGIVVSYNASTGVIASVLKNNVFVIQVCSNGTAAAATAVQAQIQYTDL